MNIIAGSKISLLEIGGLDESLFIDGVDFEWCCRAQSKGYVVGQTTKLTLTHKVGQKDFRIGKYQSIISAPFRYYYQCRNYVWLCRRKYVPKSYKINALGHILIHTLLYPLMVENGFKIVYYMWNDIWYGLTHKNEPDFKI